MFRSAAIGAGRNPPFGGGRYRLPGFFCIALWKPNSRGKPQKTKEFKECGVFHPHAFYVTPPPLSLYQKACGPQYHEKHPKFGPSNRLRKPGCPVRRITVNRDPFRKLRFGKFQEFHVPFPGLLHPSVLPQKFRSALVDCLTNRANLLLHRQPLDHLPRLRRRPKL